MIILFLGKIKERKDEIKLNQANFQHNQGQTMSIHQLIGITAVFGALFWGGIHGALYYLNLTEVSLFQIKGWFGLGKLSNNWVNFGVTIFLMCVVSYLLCYIYYFLFRTRKEYWIYIAYGVGIFVLFFIVLQPFNRNIPFITELSRLTIITNICIAILYGLFISYTISFDYHHRKFVKDGLNIEDM